MIRTTPNTPARAALKKPHCQPASETIRLTNMKDNPSPKLWLALKNPYHVPLTSRGNHREREIMAGGAPIDWLHPLIPHIMAKHMNMAMPLAPAALHETPRIPMMKLAAADMTSPVAMNFFILQWSAKNPFTNLPTA